MIDDTTLSCRDVFANEGSVMGQEPGGNVGKDDLYLPVEFLDDMRFFSLPVQEQELLSQPHNIRCIHSGSIVLTSARILLLLSCDSTDSKGCELVNGDVMTREVVVFSDVIDAVTNIRHWISDTSGYTLCYRMELMGGAHNIIFRPDGKRVMSLQGTDSGNNVMTQEIISRWACRAEQFIGQKIERCIWTDDNNDEIDGMDCSTLAWERMRETIAILERKNSTRIDETHVSPVPKDWRSQQENFTHNALTSHLSLVRDDHLVQDNISPINTMTNACVSSSLLAFVSSRSWRNGISEEVTKLLEEEERLARMKLENYAASISKRNYEA